MARGGGPQARVRVLSLFLFHWPSTLTSEAAPGRGGLTTPRPVGAGQPGPNDTPSSEVVPGEWLGGLLGLSHLLQIGQVAPQRIR